MHQAQVIYRVWSRRRAIISPEMAAAMLNTLTARAMVEISTINR